MSYKFVADIFHTNELCSRLSSSKVRFYPEIGRFAFLSPNYYLLDIYIYFLGVALMF